jgi:hypothetical protein
MTQTSWRRPFRPGGAEPSPIAAPPGLIPGTLTACPTPCTPRPRNLPEYQAACRVAQGETVAERNACEIVEGMRVYWPWRDRFVTAIGMDRLNPEPDVELRLAEPGLYVISIVPATTPVYVLAPAPDACSAPGAEAVAAESTAAVR